MQTSISVWSCFWMQWSQKKTLRPPSWSPGGQSICENAIVSQGKNTEQHKWMDGFCSNKTLESTFPSSKQEKDAEETENQHLFIYPWAIWGYMASPCSKNKRLVDIENCCLLRRHWSSILLGHIKDELLETVWTSLSSNWRQLRTTCPLQNLWIFLVGVQPGSPEKTGKPPHAGIGGKHFDIQQSILFSVT